MKLLHINIRQSYYFSGLIRHLKFDKEKFYVKLNKFIVAKKFYNL